MPQLVLPNRAELQQKNGLKRSNVVSFAVRASVLPSIQQDRLEASVGGVVFDIDKPSLINTNRRVRPDSAGYVRLLIRRLQRQ